MSWFRVQIKIYCSNEQYLELAEESRYYPYCDSKLISPGTRNKWNFCSESGIDHCEYWNKDIIIIIIVIHHMVQPLHWSHTFSLLHYYSAKERRENKNQESLQCDPYEDKCDYFIAFAAICGHFWLTWSVVVQGTVAKRLFPHDGDDVQRCLLYFSNLESLCQFPDR